MKKLLMIAIIAASLLVGCGNSVSKTESNKDSSKSPGVTTQIQVIGLDGLNGDYEKTVTKDVTATGDAIEEGSSIAAGTGEVSNPKAMIDDSIVPDKQYNAGKRVVCWGDSLTEGTGGNGVSYPSVLAERSGAETVNYGIYNDNAAQIAARAGANPQHVEGIDSIPAETVPIQVNIVSNNNGEWLRWGNRGYTGINPCNIAGVAGELYFNDDENVRYFTRLKAGDAVAVPQNTSFITPSMNDIKEDDIVVIWSGSTDGKNVDNTAGGIETVIGYQKKMLERFKEKGIDKYVIINYTAITNIGSDEIDEWNRRLEQEFGSGSSDGVNHYLDVRTYLLNCGIDYAENHFEGYKSKSEDADNINNGQIPLSLRYDDSHGNEYYYRIIGELVYKKLYDLGYLK